MNFPVRIHTKEYDPHGIGGWRWKTLCIVSCSEALGLMERILAMSQLEYNVEEICQNVPTNPPV